DRDRADLPGARHRRAPGDIHLERRHPGGRDGRLHLRGARRDLQSSGGSAVRGARSADQVRVMATTQARLTTATAKADMLRPPRSLWTDAWYQFRRHQLAMGGLGVLTFLVLATLVGPYLWQTPM